MSKLQSGIKRSIQEKGRDKAIQKLSWALWSAFYHMELDEIAGAIVNKTIDGNDHPAFRKLAEDLLSRMENEGLTVIARGF